MFKTEVLNEIVLKKSNVSRNDIVRLDYKNKIEKRFLKKKFPSSAMIPEMKCPQRQQTARLRWKTRYCSAGRGCPCRRLGPAAPEQGHQVPRWLVGCTREKVTGQPCLLCLPSAWAIWQSSSVLCHLFHCQVSPGSPAPSHSWQWRLGWGSAGISCAQDRKAPRPEGLAPKPPPCHTTRPVPFQDSEAASDCRILSPKLRLLARSQWAPGLQRLHLWYHHTLVSHRGP